MIKFLFCLVLQTREFFSFSQASKVFTSTSHFRSWCFQLTLAPGLVFHVEHLLGHLARALALHFILACEKCSLTSIHLFISQVFIEHLLISANLKLRAIIILSYATGWSRSAVN